MDYYGLFPKFKLNRPLNQEERAYQLHQRQPVDLAGQSVVSDIKVITINSHYLELVDKYYSYKGIGSLIAFFGLSCMVFVIVSTVFFSFFSFEDVSWNDVGFALAVIFPSGVMAIWMLYLLKN
ncbi:Uncharacterised protein [Serratia rubidaea]|nr:Uncharacterised protein [Serratia rubidaea]